MIIYKEEHFGTIERIKEWISDNGLTQQDLADRAEVTLRTVGRWFNEGAVIRRNNLIRIAEVMDCDLEYLECKQGSPKKSGGHKIKVETLSMVDRYLPKIRDLMSTTKQRFSYTLDCEASGSGEIIQGSFIDGETRYYYEDLAPDYTGETIYKIRINGSEEIRKTESEIEDLVKEIMRFVSYEIDQIRE